MTMLTDEIPVRTYDSGEAHRVARKMNEADVDGWMYLPVMDPHCDDIWRVGLWDDNSVFQVYW